MTEPTIMREREGGKEETVRFPPTPDDVSSITQNDSDDFFDFDLIFDFDSDLIFDFDSDSISSITPGDIDVFYIDDDEEDDDEEDFDGYFDGSIKMGTMSEEDEDD